MANSKEQAAIDSKRVMGERNMAGLCRYGDAPLAPGHNGMCIYHRDKQRASQNARYQLKASARRRPKCLRCGERGHFAKTCSQVRK
jgi:hypothetical protein